MKSKIKKVLLYFMAFVMMVTFTITDPKATFAADDDASGSTETDKPKEVNTKITVMHGEEDISDKPNIYLDTTDITGGETSTNIVVQVEKTDGSELTSNDDIVAQLSETDAGKIEKETPQKIGDGKWSIRISALKAAKPYALAKLSLTTKEGTAYRQVNIYAYTPAADISAKYGLVSSKIRTDLFAKDSKTGIYDSTASITVIANHTYQFENTLIAAKDEKGQDLGACTDSIKWEVYDGEYNGEGTPKEATKATISPDGRFTPKENGQVTIVARIKPTETSERKSSYKTIKEKVDGQTVSKQVQTIPKYIHVVIAKENPVKAMKFVNPPEVMEATGEDNSVQLLLDKTPTYDAGTESGYPTEATDVITWESSDPKIATVDENGLVTAISKGEVTITAYAEDRNIKAECKIRVMTKATSITMEYTTLNTRVGDPISLAAIMTPEDADDHIIWTVSDAEYADIIEDDPASIENKQTATLVPKKEGTVIVTAKAENSEAAISKTVNIGTKIHTKEITLSYQENKKNIAVEQDDTVQLYAGTDCPDLTINADFISDKEGERPNDSVIWKVEDNTDADGNEKYITYTPDSTSIVLHGITEGENLEKVKVTAISKDDENVQISFNVQVLKACSNVKIYEADTKRTSRSLLKNETCQLEADLTTNDANYPYKHHDVVKSWSSNNTDIATVDANGQVTAVANGTASITAVTASGRKNSFTIKVFTPSEIRVNNVTKPDGETEVLPFTKAMLTKDSTAFSNVSYTVYDQNHQAVTDCNITCVSDAPEIAAVVENANASKTLLCQKVGKANITLSCGAIETAYSIQVCADANVLNIASISDEIFAPQKEHTPEPVITLGDVTLEKDKDYTLEYSNNVNAGVAKVKVTYLGYYTGTSNLSFKISPKSIEDEDVIKPVIEKQEFTKKAITPEVVLSYMDTNLEATTDYTISYSNNIKVGTATIKLTGRGNYTGTATISFEIYCLHENKKLQKVVTPATCTTDGEASYVCSDCNTTWTEPIPMTGHQYSDEWTIDKYPTTTEKGEKSHHCKLCDDRKDIEEIDVIPDIKTTKMHIFNAEGTEISDNANIYLDASPCAGGATSTELRVTISDKDDKQNEYLTDNLIVAIEKSSPEKIKYSCERVNGSTWTIKISALTSVSPYGITKLTLSTEAGEVYRVINVRTYTPAVDMGIKFGSVNNGANIELLGKADNGTNTNVRTGGVQVIANHQYKFEGSLVAGKTADNKDAGTCTDSIKWQLCDGAYTGGEMTPTDKAEISEDGILTPKKNGVVTLVAGANATETSDRKEAYVTVTTKEKDPETGKDVTKETKVVTLPKYIQIFIVKENPAKELKFKNTPKVLEVTGDNSSVQLLLEKTPTFNSEEGYASDATDEIRWETSDSNVATVDQNGIVTAKGKGDVTITAYAENPNVSTSCTIHVMTKASTLSFVSDQNSTRVGVPLKISVKMNPVDADDHIIWTSSDEAIAEVLADDENSTENEQSATIIPKAEGTITITATAENSGKSVTKTFNINKRIVTKDINLSYTNQKESTEIKDGDTIQVFAGTNCPDITVQAVLASEEGDNPDDKVVWTVEGNKDADGNEKYFTYSYDDKQITIHGFAEGEKLEKVKVIATSETDSSIQKVFLVQVLKACNNVKIYEAGSKRTSRSLLKNETCQLEADLTTNDSVYPYKHHDSVQSWTSNNPEIASVDEKGVVTAKKNGNAVITVVTASGKTATYNIHVYTSSEIRLSGVKKPEEGVSKLPYLNVNLDKDSKATSNISFTVYDEEEKSVTNANVDVTSENPEIASIVTNENGTKSLDCKKVGSTIIKLTCGAVTTSYQVNVYAASNVLAIDSIEDIVYTPDVDGFEPKPVIKLGEVTLKEGTDYTLKYENNEKAGNAKITVTYLGFYTGTSTVNFKITQKSIADEDIVKPVIEKLPSTKEAQTPDFVFTYKGVTLVKDTDYTVAYANNTKPGIATITITGKGNYNGTAKITFEIYCNHVDKKVLSIIKDATCTENGEEKYTCPDCKLEWTEAIPAKGHTYEEKVVEPTCTEKGYTSHICSVCGDTYKDTEVAPLGHDFETTWSIDKEANCLEEGSKSHHCKRCDAKSDVTAISKTTHEFDSGEVTKEATCTEEGEKTSICRICKQKKVEKIPATGHSYNKEWSIDKEATCTEDGTKSHHCFNCDDKKDVTVIPKTGHTFDEGTITTKATCTKAGVKTYTCTKCGETKTEEIPATGHDFSVKKNTVAPTTTTEGYTIYKCKNCSETTKKDVTAKLPEKNDTNSGTTNNNPTPGNTSSGNTATDSTNANRSNTENSGNASTQAPDNHAQSNSENQNQAAAKAVLVAKRNKTTISVKSSKKAKIAVRIKKKNVAKYQIMYSLKKNFKSAKKVTTKATKLTLKAKTKRVYYVKVRTITVVNGKAYAGSWSKTKKVRVR